MRLSFQPFLFDRFLSDFSFSTKFYIIHSSITERNPLPSNVRVVSKSQTQSLSSQDGLTSRFKTFRLLHQDLCNLHIERCHKSIGFNLVGCQDKHFYFKYELPHLHDAFIYWRHPHASIKMLMSSTYWKIMKNKNSTLLTQCMHIYT